jgi:hypothetical protein
MPRLVFRFSISCNNVTVIRVPVHPMGWPIAMAPPLTLSRSRLKFSSLITGEHLRRERLIQFHQAEFVQPVSCASPPACASAGTGPIPMVRGSTPADVTAIDPRQRL